MSEDSPGTAVSVEVQHYQSYAPSTEVSQQSLIVSRFYSSLSRYKLATEAVAVQTKKRLVRCVGRSMHLIVESRRCPILSIEADSTNVSMKRSHEDTF